METNLMRVLVTGGGGFLGYQTTCALADRGDTVVAFDTAFGKPLLELASSTDQVHVEAGDMTDLANVAQVFDRHRPNAVVHLAAVVGVPASIGSPANILRVNVQGSLNVFEAMRLFNVQRVIHMSTEEVYGDFERACADEEHPQRPTNPYGVTKLAVEHFGRSYGEFHGLQCINLRTSWVYGVGLDRPRPPMNYLEAALAGRQVDLPSGADTVIDYAYVDDVVNGILLALDHPSHRYDVYNVASGQGVSDQEMIDEIRRLLPEARLKVGPGRRPYASGHRMPVKGALDCSRACEEFGYVPRYDIRRGIAAYVNRWRERAAAA
jgi:UDP-glucose 4-epimerase